MSTASVAVDVHGLERLPARLRRVVTARAVDRAFHGLARLGGALPHSRPERHAVERIPDVVYRRGGGSDLRLDVYRPAGADRALPVVLYAHGGGFRALSKDTHWLMGLAFARRGFLVLNVDYRLAPRHRFPAPLEDVCDAFLFALREASAYGGDPHRIVLAGESAGANLVTALAVATCWRRPEPYARAVFDAGVVPRAVLPACGLLQVTDPDRLARRRPLSVFVTDQIRTCAIDYLPKGAAPEHVALADPLLILEGSEAPDRPLPPFFASVGTRDPLIDDTRRLGAALGKLGTRCETRIYPRELHAFQALIWRENARRCWEDTFEFLSGIEGLGPH